MVYCLEEADLDGSLSEIALPPSSELREKWEPDLLGGVMTIEAEGRTITPEAVAASLYAPSKKERTSPVRLKAIPYCAWDNRAPGATAVWIPEEV
jgi:DUF1680 family protein